MRRSSRRQLEQSSPQDDPPPKGKIYRGTNSPAVHPDRDATRLSTKDPHMLNAAGTIDLDDSKASLGRRAAVLDSGNRKHELWFERADGEPAPTESADMFVLASLLYWMSIGSDVHVNAVVTRETLANVEELQHVWSRWRPDRYRRIRISAEQTVDARHRSAGTALAYSGGLDAQYSLLRHVWHRAGHQNRHIDVAAMVHGFDIPLGEQDNFDRSAERAASILSTVDVPLTTIRTNFREIPQEWQDSHALGLAAALNLLSEHQGVGLIASGKPYDLLDSPWGSSPITDHLLSTGSLEIRHDGAGASRTEKAMLFAESGPSIQHLRVCWQSAQRDKNCGRCEKCLRTYWNLRVAGVDNPSCFQEIRLSPFRVLTGPRQIAEWESIRSHANDTGHSRAVRFATYVIRYNKVRQLMRRVPFTQRLADLLRGRASQI